jgi:hypothetical protein
VSREVVEHSLPGLVRRSGQHREDVVERIAPRPVCRNDTQMRLVMVTSP